MKIKKYQTGGYFVGDRGLYFSPGLAESERVKIGNDNFFTTYTDNGETRYINVNDAPTEINGELVWPYSTLDKYGHIRPVFNPDTGNRRLTRVLSKEYKDYLSKNPSSKDTEMLYYDRLKNRGLITQAEDTNPVVGKVNKNWREFNYYLSNPSAGPMPGKFSIPAILTAGVLAPSATTLTPMQLASGIAAVEGVNTVSGLTTGKSWGENISNLTGLDSDLAEYSNPGMLVTGVKNPALSFRQATNLLNNAYNISKNIAKAATTVGRTENGYRVGPLNFYKGDYNLIKDWKRFNRSTLGSRFPLPSESLPSSGVKIEIDPLFLRALRESRAGNLYLLQRELLPYMHLVEPENIGLYSLAIRDLDKSFTRFYSLDPYQTESGSATRLVGLEPYTKLDFIRNPDLIRLLGHVDTGAHGFMLDPATATPMDMLTRLLHARYNPWLGKSEGNYIRYLNPRASGVLSFTHDYDTSVDSSRLAYWDNTKIGNNFYPLVAPGGYGSQMYISPTPGNPFSGRVLLNGFGYKGLYDRPRNWTITPELQNIIDQYTLPELVKLYENNGILLDVANKFNPHLFEANSPVSVVRDDLGNLTIYSKDGAKRSIGYIPARSHDDVIGDLNRYLKVMNDHFGTSYPDVEPIRLPESRDPYRRSLIWTSPSSKPTSLLGPGVFGVIYKDGGKVNKNKK